MRVLFNSWRDLAHPLAGGAEVVLDQLADGLVRRGHEVVVRCGGPIGERTYEVQRGGGDLSQYLNTPLHHRRLGRDVDVVVDVSNGMSFFTPLFDRSVPTVAFVHHVHTAQWGMYFPAPVAAIGRRLETDAMPLAYRSGLTVTVSPSSKQSLIEIGMAADRIRVLPPAATLDPCAVERSTTPLFVALGRLTAHKRIDLLLDMWERVHPIVGGELVIIGDGPERTRLESRRVSGTRFLGSVDEATKASVLGAAWTLVHSASHEGWGLVITEAGLAATPSLGFDVAGVRDAIVDGSSGVLAADADDFVASWIALAADSSRRGALGAGAYHRATAAKLETRIDVFEEVLCEAARLHRQARIPDVLGRIELASNSAMVSAPRGATRHGRAINSIVIPAYNEAARLPRLLAALGDHVDLETTEVIVVDDGSIDDTAAIASNAMADLPFGQVIRLETNAGKGAALRRGVAAVRGEFVVFMDADMATDLACLPALLAALTDAPVAIGSRAIHGAIVHDASLQRRVMGGVFNAMVRRVTQVHVTDSQCGFKAFRSDLARLLFAASVEDGFALDVELLDLTARLGFEVAEVPVRWHAVPGSKIRPGRDAARMALAVARIARRSRRAVFPVVTITDAADPVATFKEVRDLVRAGDPVFIDDDGISVVLPGIDPAGVAVVGARLDDELGVSTRRWSIESSQLFAARN